MQLTLQFHKDSFPQEVLEFSHNFGDGSLWLLSKRYQNLVDSQIIFFGGSLINNLQRKYWATSHRKPSFQLPYSPIRSSPAIPIPCPKTKKERKEWCANGQINRVHIAITSLQTPRWPIGEDRRWEKILDGFTTRMCIQSASKEVGEKIDWKDRRYNYISIVFGKMS